MTTITCYDKFTPAQSAHIERWINRADELIIEGFRRSCVSAPTSSEVTRISRIAAKGYTEKDLIPTEWDQIAFSLSRIKLALAGKYDMDEARMHAFDALYPLRNQIAKVGEPATRLLTIFSQLHAALTMQSA